MMGYTLSIRLQARMRLDVKNCRFQCLDTYFILEKTWSVKGEVLLVLWARTLLLTMNCFLSSAKTFVEACMTISSGRGCQDHNALAAAVDINSK